MRASPVLILLAAARLVLPVPPVAAAGNPHNLGSCPACHATTPSFGRDTRQTVSYTTSEDDPGLCTSCHPAGVHRHPVLVAAGSGPAGARTSDYLRPGTSAALSGTIVCTSCHFIHASDTRHGLLRGFPGSPDPHYFLTVAAFCRECHGANLQSRSPHGGGEGTCAFCHSGQTRPGGLAETPASFRERCEVCHGRKGDEHFAGLNPFGRRGECTFCHDEHAVAAASPALLSESYRTAAAESYDISPHFRSSFCFACHENSDDYELRDENPNALCDRCHASGKIRSNIHPLRKVPPRMTVPRGWPLTDGALTCLTCHEQGHDDQPRQPWMLRGGPYAFKGDVCWNCHAIADLKSSAIHREISESKSCEICHATRPRPGTDSIRTVNFIGGPDALCRRCHDQDETDGSVHHGNVIGREILEGHIPAALPLFKGRVICATCHDPHLREAAGSRLRADLRGSNFCSGCHPE